MWRSVLTVGLIFCGCEATVTCKNNNNGNVDWYILYKAPEMSTPTLTGLEYIYIDSTGATTMRPSTPNYKSIKNREGALANTLRPLFTPIRSMPSDFGFISYSDQPPGCHASQNFGHSKGVLMVDRTDSGVWLLHSTPQFPYRRNQDNFWPQSGKTNAQIFICVTFPYEEFRKIGNHLQYIRAFPFEHDLPEQFHEELKAAANWVTQDVPQNFQTINSKASTTFYSIAKQSHVQPKVGDLYVTIGKILMNCDVEVQTWGCQRERARSYCYHNLPNVINIESIKTGLAEWSPSKDHSKWCIGTNLNSDYVCIADMNRAPTQYVRHGGALCLKNRNTKEIFERFVKGQEDCPTPNIMNVQNMDCDDLQD